MSVRLAIVLCLMVSVASATEELSVERAVEEVTASMHSLRPSERMRMLGQVGFETRYLNDEQWLPIRSIIEKDARGLTGEELIHSDEALRVWAPNIALDSYRRIEDVDKRDAVYSRFAISAARSSQTRLTSNMAEAALDRISLSESKSRTEMLLRQIAQQKACSETVSSPSEVLQQLSSEPNLAIAEFSQKYLHGLPLIDVIANSKTPLPEAQGYVDELFRIADELQDACCAANLLFAVADARRDGLRIPSLKERIKPLRLEQLNEVQLLSIFRFFGHDLQKDCLRQVYRNQHVHPKKDTGGYAGGQPRTGLESVTPEALGIEATIPLSQKRNYFRHLLNHSATPYERYRLCRSIARFDIYWALTVFWKIRDDLSEHERPWDDAGGYGRASWPNEHLGWLKLLLGVPWSDWQQHPVEVNDEQLLEAINRFLPSVTQAEDKEALLLYRLGAEVRLRDRAAATRTAKLFVIAEYRVYAFSRLIRMISSPTAH